MKILVIYLHGVKENKFRRNSLYEKKNGSIHIVFNLKMIFRLSKKKKKMNSLIKLIFLNNLGSSNYFQCKTPMFFGRRSPACIGQISQFCFSYANEHSYNHENYQQILTNVGLSYFSSNQIRRHYIPCLPDNKWLVYHWKELIFGQANT